jgi:GH18 family chitinase
MNRYSPSGIALPSRFTTDQGWMSFDTSPRMLADVNGDGRSDVVAFGYSAVWWARSTDNKAYQLSTDLPGGPYNLASQDNDSIYDFNPAFMRSIAQSVDFINVMNYVYHGAWYEFTGHDAPLFSNPQDTSYNHQKTNTDWSIDQYIVAGVDPKNLILGLPAFGFRWNNVANPLKNGGYLQPGQGEWHELADSDIVALKSQPGYIYYWDDVAQVPYLYNATTSQFISYNDPRAIAAKATYTQQTGLGGLFFWQIIVMSRSTIPIR